MIRTNDVIYRQSTRRWFATIRPRKQRTFLFWQIRILEMQIPSTNECMLSAPELIERLMSRDENNEFSCNEWSNVLPWISINPLYGYSIAFTSFCIKNVYQFFLSNFYSTFTFHISLKKKDPNFFNKIISSLWFLIYFWNKFVKILQDNSKISEINKMIRIVRNFKLFYFIFDWKQNLPKLEPTGSAWKS